MDISEKLIRGKKVLVKALDGPAEATVWEDCGDAVLVCSERQYDALKRGWDAPMPIGFPKRDVAPK